MCSKSKIDAVELVKKSRASDNTWLTRPEAIAVIRELTGCGEKQAVEILDTFKEDMPDGWKTVALN